MTTTSPLEQLESLCIGTVEFVSPDEIKVSLNAEAPESIALNAENPITFPKINNYLLIPNNEGYLVGQIEWLANARTPHPKSKNTQRDSELVDLPYSARKMSLNPVGILNEIRGETNEEGKNFEFKRGVNVFPSVGDNVLLPTQKQLHAIIVSGEGKQVSIGVSPLADGAEVSVSPDRLFGRHLAVLGNTGSGKSCSVAGLIRWSLEAASKKEDTPNARFIVLDPNGEYSKAFGSDDNGDNGEDSNEDSVVKARIFQAEPSSDNEEKLQVPLWFLNSSEWAAFAQASEKTQRPTLVDALRNVRNGRTEFTRNKSHDMRNHLRTIVTIVGVIKHYGDAWARFPKPQDFFKKIKKWNEGGLEENDSFKEDKNKAMRMLKEYIDELVKERSIGEYIHYDFTKDQIDHLLELAHQAHYAFGGKAEDLLAIDADTPKPFSKESFIKSIEASAEMLSVIEYVEPMLMRIRAMLSDQLIKSIMDDSSNKITLAQWLKDYIGGNKNESNITVIDLSLIPAGVVHTLTAVIARVIFEALQRYRKIHADKKTLPVIMVMEEAHTFVKHYKDDIENRSSATICCKIFEKIAREGRKFGLGLVISSQRPSELSSTVLSQCNTFLLHRISNDRDQDLVRRFIPENQKGVLRELPVLPSQQAILMGWASELPLLVKMSHLPEEQRPKSDDPDIWKVWIGENKRRVDWDEIADDWVKPEEKTDSETKSEEETNSDTSSAEEANPEINNADQTENNDEEETDIETGSANQTGGINDDIPF